MSSREKSAELCNQARKKRREEGEGGGGLKGWKGIKRSEVEMSEERC